MNNPKPSTTPEELREKLAEPLRYNHFTDEEGAGCPISMYGGPIEDCNCAIKDAVDESMQLFTDLCGEVIDWGEWMIGRCDLHERYTSACCGCQKAKYALAMNGQRMEWQRNCVTKLTGKEIKG